MGSIFTPCKFMPCTQICCLLQHICNRRNRSYVSGSSRKICGFKRSPFVPVLSHARRTVLLHDEKCLRTANICFYAGATPASGAACGISRFHRGSEPEGVKRPGRMLFKIPHIYKSSRLMKLVSDVEVRCQLLMRPNNSQK